MITPFTFGDDRLRGSGYPGGQILPVPIDFDGRLYSTLTLPCERVITFEVAQLMAYINVTQYRRTDRQTNRGQTYDGIIRPYNSTERVKYGRQKANCWRTFYLVFNAAQTARG